MLRLLWLDMVAKVQFGSNTAGLTMWQFSLPGGRYATLDSKDAWIWHRQTCSSESQDLQDAKKTFSHLRDGCAVDMVPDTTSRRAAKFDPARLPKGIGATLLKPCCWESYGRLMADHLEAVLADDRDTGAPDGQVNRNRFYQSHASSVSYGHPDRISSMGGQFIDVILVREASK